MNITKGDVQELRRRLKKNECTFERMCGCYVNSGKQIVLKFTEHVLRAGGGRILQVPRDREKTFSGTLGSKPARAGVRPQRQRPIERQHISADAASDSKLANEELLDRLYEKVIEEYSYPGNYLIRGLPRRV
ncbi:MAG: DUF4317 family protein [Butyricicoccaceae bacterium]